MELREYQRLASQTDHTPGDGEFQTALQVLALQSKVGDLSGNFKKFYRKQKTNAALKGAMARSIGDILWYLASVANSSKLDLNEIAEQNLARVRELHGERAPSLFDPVKARISHIHERFPSPLTFEFYSASDLADKNILRVKVVGPDGNAMGDEIDDNEYHEDNYRYHDAMHICFMTFVGWSPVMRKLLGIKRKSSDVLDRVEDGAKARDIEEALSKRIFDYLIENDFLEGVIEVDSDILAAIPGMLGQREGSWITGGDWNRAIIEAARLMRFLIAGNGGMVIADLSKQTVEYREIAVAVA